MTGIDLAPFPEIVCLPALTAPIDRAKGPSMANGEYAARFYLEHMHKDVHLAAASADAMHVERPSMPTLKDRFDRAMEMGLAKHDYSAVPEALIHARSGSTDPTATTSR